MCIAFVTARTNRWQHPSPLGGFEGLLLTLHNWLKGDIGTSLYYGQQVTRLWGITVATSYMTEMCARFPEAVQMGGTFKTNRFEYYHEDGVAARVPSL